MKTFTITVGIDDGYRRPVRGSHTVVLEATDDADNEANAGRIAGQMVGQLFRLQRERDAAKPYSDTVFILTGKLIFWLVVVLAATAAGARAVIRELCQ